MDRLRAEHPAEVFRGGDAEAGDDVLHVAYDDIDRLHRAGGLFRQDDGKVFGICPGGVQSVLPHVPYGDADGEHSRGDQQNRTVREGCATADPAAQTAGDQIRHALEGDRRHGRSVASIGYQAPKGAMS